MSIRTGGLGMGWLVAAGGVAAAAGLMAYGIWRLGVKSQRPRRLPNAETPSVPFEPVEFRSGGSRLNGWLLRPPADSPQPAVIVAHGWGSNRSRVLRYAEPLIEAGFAVFLFDARSHGDSDVIEAPSGFAFRDDIKAAVETVRRLPGIDSQRIAILGHSLGGFGALLAYTEGLPVRAVVADSTPLRFDTMMRAELSRRRLPHFPLAAIISRIWLRRSGITRQQVIAADIPAWLEANHDEGRLPVLLVHSRRDGFVPPDDLIGLTDRFPVRHLLVDTEGHSVSQQDPAFWAAVLPFLKEALGDDAPGTGPG